MNSNIIPAGVTEVVTGNNVVASACLFVLALADTDLTAVVMQFPATFPNPGATNAFTLKAGSYLFNVKSFGYTGTLQLVYRTTGNAS